jgi:CRP/FNR family transcriptional regulator, cyclic AMP receptor protein
VDPGRLKEISLFAQLPEDEVRRIAKLATETSVGEGEALVREGDFAYEFFAIEEGHAEVRRGDEVLATLGPGDVFGETGVLAKQLRNADVIATDPVRVVVLSRWDVRRLRKNLPDLDEQIQAVMAQRSA